MNAGLIGGVLGGVIGLAGGIIGTCFSIKNTKGPKERSFMIKASAVYWVFGLLFVTLLLILPSPYKWFLWLPYSVFLPSSIVILNKKLNRIIQEESQNR